MGGISRLRCSAAVSVGVGIRGPVFGVDIRKRAKLEVMGSQAWLAK